MMCVRHCQREQRSPRMIKAVSSASDCRIRASPSAPIDNSKPRRSQSLDSTFWQDLGKLNNLRWLDLSGSNVRDEDLRCIGHFPLLMFLRLHDTEVTDEGVKQLAELQWLEGLDLAGTNVSDKSVEFLVKLSHLTWLNIRGATISGDMVERLQTALPDCNIEQ